jgi:TPP-dependent pyruvate/acetoin dehydrogenase alpha subunit
MSNAHATAPHSGDPSAPLQLLDRDGRVSGAPPMTAEQTREALELMLLSRAIDELATKLQRLKRVGLYAPVYGQEAAVVGSAMTLDPSRDWLVPASREQPAMLRHGWPLESFFASYMGRLEHAGIPGGVKLLPRQQAIAAQLPHATGIAWALKLRGEAGVVMVYCGDGASSEGDFHEALNLAGVLRVPLVVVLINNQYAISTPVHKQTAATSFASRATGYGMPGALVDGNDVFAVYAASHDAVERALHGQGPTLIECRTYRLGFHNTSDNPNDYRAPEEFEAALENDPIKRLERYVLDGGLCSDDELGAMRESMSTRIDSVQRTVATLPRPGAGYIFDHVYDTLPARVEQERAMAAPEG